jgi:hypothetical protein
MIAAESDKQQPTYSRSLIAELERKFVLADDGKGSACEESPSTRAPIGMLGGLVSPHLRKAQASLPFSFSGLPLYYLACLEPHGQS